MRIINNPNPVPGTVVVCPKCQCEFEYSKNDEHHESWNNGIIGPGFSGYHHVWVNCPNCGEIYKISW